MHPDKKKKLLLCWWYDRPDLFAHFLALTDTFEITVIFYRFREQEELTAAIPCKRLYWTDHPSPYHILDQVQPDIVGFMGVEDALTLGLLLAARHRSLRTYYIAHGITLSYRSLLAAYDQVQKELLPERYDVENPVYHKNKSHSLKFLMRAIRPGNLHVVPYLLRFLLAARKYSKVCERLYHAPSPIRMPDRYIVFSMRFGRMLAERDRVPAQWFVEAGPYTLDGLFQSFLDGEQVAAPDGLQDYLLLIDQPIVQVTHAGKVAFYQKLAQAAAAVDRLLVVKLHPTDYERPGLPDDPNIRYVRATGNMAALIMHADGCYGFYSTLLLPTVYYKKCVLFRIGDDELTREWGDMGLVKVLDFHDFKPADAGFDMQPIPESVREAYLKSYIISADGQSVQRLRQALLDNVPS